MNQSCRNCKYLASFGGDYRTGDIIGWCNLRHKIVLFIRLPGLFLHAGWKTVKYVYDGIINAFIPTPVHPIKPASDFCRGAPAPAFCVFRPKRTFIHAPCYENRLAAIETA
jgi:hypothetical protein